MSYEPTIIVRKSDLEKNREQIISADTEVIAKKKFRGKNAKQDKQDLIYAYNVLFLALDENTIAFPEIELVFIYVEFTSRNAHVRNLLTELKIDFRVWE